MYLLMGLASVMLGLLVQDRQPICGFTRNTTFNVRPIRKDSVRIPASGMKLAVEVYLRKANGAACGCRQPGTPPQDIPLNTPSCPFKEQGSLYLLGYGPLSAMTYLSNKDYLR